MEYVILENRGIFQNYFELILDISEDDNIPIPGQFYTIRCADTKDPLLRRPFSMHRLTYSGKSVQLEILYRVVGKGTEWLSRRQRGQCLDVIGPLGNGFVIEDNVNNIVIVARGMGIAPLYAVGEEYLKRKGKSNIHMLIGARCKERIYYQKECQKIGKTYVYTDDGSLGFYGKAPDLLRHLLKQRKIPENFILYACGPPEMLKELSELADRIGFDGQVALEEHMGCGFGACLSCACRLVPEHIKKNDQWKKEYLQFSEDGKVAYSLICKDGPIYDIREVYWDEWFN